MRNPIVAIVASSVLLGISIPAYAGTYSCQILKDDTVVKECKIEAGGQICVFGYRPDLIGGCGAQTGQGTTQELLICGVVKPGAEQRLMSGNVKPGGEETFKALREQPGFLARALTFVQSDSPGAIVLNYQESDTAPVLSLLCWR